MLSPADRPQGAGSCSARSEAHCFPQGAMQAIDQRIDLAAVTLEDQVESLVAIEPSAQGAVHFVGAFSNVGCCLWGLCNFPQDGACFDERARVLGRTFAGKLRERITQLFGLISVHRSAPQGRGKSIVAAVAAVRLSNASAIVFPRRDSQLRARRGPRS